MERYRASQGHRRRGRALVRDQPPQGEDREPGLREARGDSRRDGFPPEAWFEKGLPGAELRKPADADRDLAERIDLLFEVVVNPKTGEPYTNADVARMSLGVLGEEDAARLRNGSVPNAPLDHVIALADVFGVHISYLVDRGGKAPFLDEEIVDALRDDTVRAIARGSTRLGGRERKAILGIVREFERASKEDAARASAGGL